MNTKIMLIAMTVFSMAASPVLAEAELKIYLPRTITLEGDALTLGQVAIIRGSEPLASQAAEVALGQISSPDQSLVISRNLVLSRLACSGIPASKVLLTGAEETCVTRQHQRIKGSRLAEEATAYLKTHLPNKSICQLDVVRLPNDLILPGDKKKVTLACRLGANNTRNQCSVQVTALLDGKEIGQQDVTFKFRYQCRKAITKAALPKGTPISTENVTIKDEISNYPEPAGWTPPYGLVTTRFLAANTVLTANSVSPAKPEVLLKRNQTVSIVIDRPGLMATANGKALQDANAGDCIKVQNIDSQVVIIAKVNDNGTVEPVF